MPTEYRHSRIEGSSNSGSEISNLVKCILKRFNHVSTNRIHKISFLIEYEYFDRTGSKMTNATYYRVMDGCRSDEISLVIEDLDTVDHKEVTIAGENIHTIQPGNDIDCNAPVEDDEYFAEIADHVIQNYGDISKDEINTILETISIYKNTDLGEEIAFQPVR